MTDAGGESLTMLDIDGFKLSLFGHTPEYITNVYKNLPNFRFRKDDIFLASYPKAGKDNSRTWPCNIHRFFTAVKMKKKNKDKKR